MITKLRTLLFLFWLIVPLGCTDRSTNITTQPPSSTLDTATPVRTVVPSRTSILTPTHSITWTVPLTTVELESSKTPDLPTLVPPSLTPLPTLSSSKSEKLVQELLLNNGDCEYPCWWGIVPGKTTWSEAYHFLASFVEVIPHRDNNGIDGAASYSISYPLKVNVMGEGGFRIAVENGQILRIFVGRDS